MSDPYTIRVECVMQFRSRDQVIPIFLSLSLTWASTTFFTHSQASSSFPRLYNISLFLRIPTFLKCWLYFYVFSDVDALCQSPFDAILRCHLYVYIKLPATLHYAKLLWIYSPPFLSIFSHFYFFCVWSLWEAFEQRFRF